MKNQKCKCCGKVITGRSDRKYCSNSCRQNAYRGNHTETGACKRCGKDFVRIIRPERIYCSSECRITSL